MSAEVLTASIEKQLELHKSLYELAVKKTDIIKKGDMEALNQILKEEQTLIVAIEQMEKERKKAAKVIVPGIDEPTISECLNVLGTEEQDRLTELVDELSTFVFDLKQLNYLNQQLIHHSLQFVRFSMGLLQPQTPNINYQPPSKNQKSSEHNSISMFNSEA